MKKNTIMLATIVLIILLLACTAVLFARKTTFNVEMNVGSEGGAITSEQGLINGATSVVKGKDLKIYLIPNEGYEIEKVLVDNEEIDINTLVYEKNNPNAASEDGVAIYTFESVNNNHTIEAYYKIK